MKKVVLENGGGPDVWRARDCWAPILAVQGTARATSGARDNRGADSAGLLCEVETWMDCEAETGARSNHNEPTI